MNDTTATTFKRPRYSCQYPDGRHIPPIILGGNANAPALFSPVMNKEKRTPRFRPAPPLNHPRVDVSTSAPESMFYPNTMRQTTAPPLNFFQGDRSNAQPAYAQELTPHPFVASPGSRILVPSTQDSILTEVPREADHAKSQRKERRGTSPKKNGKGGCTSKNVCAAGYSLEIEALNEKPQENIVLSDKVKRGRAAYVNPVWSSSAVDITSPIEHSSQRSPKNSNRDAARTSLKRKPSTSSELGGGFMKALSPVKNSQTEAMPHGSDRSWRRHAGDEHTERKEDDRIALEREKLHIERERLWLEGEKLQIERDMVNTRKQRGLQDLRKERLAYCRSLRDSVDHLERELAIEITQEIRREHGL